MTCFSIQNFGCRVNQAEAFGWAEELESSGLSLEKDAARADLVIVNTCTLTSKADRDVRKFIRRVSRLNPRARLVVAGCSVDGGRKRFEESPGIWLTALNREKTELVEKILSRVERGAAAEFSPLRSRALLKVQDGCDQRCAFCIIPLVRGASRSEPQANILARAQVLIQRGFREIVLCGIHLNSYGFDLRPPGSLSGLLRSLAGLDGLGRIRLSSLDPRYLNDPLIEWITSSPKICPHFHLSLQHGSDRLLKLMARGSNTSEYSGILARLRRASPNAALGADIIVGFPGEFDEDFEAVFEFLRSSPLDYLHVFSYSPRPGTPAAGRPQVPETVKRERSAALRAWSGERRLAFHRAFLSRELEAIVVRKQGSAADVLTSNYIAVNVSTCSAAQGEEVRVKILRAGPKQAAGEVVTSAGPYDPPLRVDG
jgi:threonylcarbamoyladenosine tRNA methylthiotransferase MtaB